MNERWVTYDGQFFNMSNVTHFYQSGNGIIVCFTYKEKSQDRLRLCLKTSDREEYEREVQEIIAGQYDTNRAEQFQ